MRINQNQIKILFWCCVIMVFVFSCLPGSGSNLAFFAIQNLDKLAHFMTFFVLSILLLFAYSFKNPFLITIILMASFGMMIEILHLYVPNRTFSILDFVADISGIFAAIIIYIYLVKRLDLTTPQQ